MLQKIEFNWTIFKTLDGMPLLQLMSQILVALQT